MMHYWRLRVNPAPNTDYEVYYKTPINLSRENVARNAVIDGDLLGAFLPCVDQVAPIKADEYFEHMYE